MNSVSVPATLLFTALNPISSADQDGRRQPPAVVRTITSNTGQDDITCLHDNDVLIDGDFL